MFNVSHFQFFDKGKPVIDLHYWPAPNGCKPSILHDECPLPGDQTI